MKAHVYKPIGAYTLAVVAVTMLLMGRCAGGCGKTQPTTSDTVTVEKWDTITETVHDTVPKVRNERIVKYIPMPATDATGTVVDSLAGKATGTVADSMAVVQREYSDDSTYTAWVSGLRYGKWPILDSIIVRRSVVTHTIKETVTVKEKCRRWGVSITAGPMYDVTHGQGGVGIMIGVSYRLF